ncbi:MAG: hypothetical protein ABI237_14600 [Ginsengibacter sp.]
MNKDKPMMHCDGKCYLSQKIKEQQKQDQQSPVPKSERFDIAPFFIPKPFVLKNTIAILKVKYFIKDESIISHFHSTIFHPPTV